MSRPLTHLFRQLKELYEAGLQLLRAFGCLRYFVVHVLHVHLDCFWIAASSRGCESMAHRLRKGSVDGVGRLCK